MIKLLQPGQSHQRLECHLGFDNKMSDIQGHHIVCLVVIEKLKAAVIFVFKQFFYFAIPSLRSNI